jgi:sulfur-oxidizing protein SoxY
MNVLTRRACVRGGGLWLLACAVPARAAAPDLRDSAALQAALARFAAGAPVREGRVQLELPEMVENGNAVPTTVSVDSPMSATDHVVAIALVTGRNPLPEVAEFRLGPRAGRARVVTRIRLATSQKVVAAARMSDGSVWTRTMDVLVTLAACVEG